MNVPNPLPFSEAWSPVGYQVVQIADETGPPECRPASVPAQLPYVPRSPLGYQIVKVWDEEPEIGLPPHLQVPRIRRRLVDPPKRSPNVAAFAAIGGACTIGFLVIASMVVSRTTAPHFQGRAVDGMWQVEAVIPAEFKDDLGGALPPGPDDKIVRAAPQARQEPQAGGVAPANGKCEECAAGGRETFGTDVQFARNPQEAYRLARAERKLVLILHVAGNFEDSRFT
jgi:hypothetical protein